MISNDKSAKLSVEFPFYYISGSEKTYAEQSIRDYSVLKLQVALVINNLINFYVSGPLLGHLNVKKLPFTLGLGFSPSNIFKVKQ